MYMWPFLLKTCIPAGKSQVPCASQSFTEAEWTQQKDCLSDVWWRWNILKLLLPKLSHSASSLEQKPHWCCCNFFRLLLLYSLLRADIASTRPEPPENVIVSAETKPPLHERTSESLCTLSCLLPEEDSTQSPTCMWANVEQAGTTTGCHWD